MRAQPSPAPNSPSPAWLQPVGLLELRTKAALADPQEPTYRQGDDAVFHWRGGDRRSVSWAHGVKKVYHLARMPWYQ